MCRFFQGAGGARAPGRPGGGAPGLVGGLLRALACGLGHVEGVLSGMEAQALEGLEDLAGGERGRRSRRLRPLLPGRGAPAVLGGEGRGDRDCQRKSHDDAALACHVPLLGAKGASVKPPRGRERRVSIARLLACRRLRSAPMPLGGKLRPGGPLAAALAAGLVVRVASCAIRSCIPTGPRTWSWRARCCAGRSWRCSAGTTRRSIPPPWPGSRRPGP